MKVKCVLNCIKISVLRIRSFWGARLVGGRVDCAVKETPRVKAGKRLLGAPCHSVPELLGSLELRDGSLGDSNPEETSQERV